VGMKSYFHIVAVEIQGQKGGCMTKIFMEADEDLPAGWYGAVNGVTINHYIYARVKDESLAFEFKPYDAFREVQEMRDKGYRARCVPPVRVSL
jgi:hypothetical protein